MMGRGERYCRMGRGKILQDGKGKDTVDKDIVYWEGIGEQIGDIVIVVGIIYRRRVGDPWGIGRAEDRLDTMCPRVAIPRRAKEGGGRSNGRARTRSEAEWGGISRRERSKKEGKEEKRKRRRERKLKEEKVSEEKEEE